MILQRINDMKFKLKLMSCLFAAAAFLVLVGAPAIVHSDTVQYINLPGSTIIGKLNAYVDWEMNTQGTYHADPFLITLDVSTIDEQLSYEALLLQSADKEHHPIGGQGGWLKGGYACFYSSSIYPPNRSGQCR